jgi:glutamine---fructose-6-phosphate transaminase (isomerizing)
MTDRVAALRADLDRAPAVLGAVIEAYAGGDSPFAGLANRLEGRRLVFSGLGSSRYAALTAESLLRSRGRSAWSEYASSGQPTAATRDLALIAISASGRTADVVEAAHRHRGTSLVVAITNDPGSPLAREADAVLPLLAGTETAGISTLTYRATLAVLGLVAGIRIDRLRGTVDRLAELADSLATGIAAAADLLDGAPAIDILADAAALGTAEQGALMLREAPRLPAHAGETGDWLHTSVYLAWPGHLAVLYAGATADGDVVATIVRRGGQVVAVGAPIPEASVIIETGRREADGPFERAILESLVADRLALALWDRATAKG